MLLDSTGCRINEIFLQVLHIFPLNALSSYIFPTRNNYEVPLQPPQLQQFVEMVGIEVARELSSWQSDWSRFVGGQKKLDFSWDKDADIALTLPTTNRRSACQQQTESSQLVNHPANKSLPPQVYPIFKSLHTKKETSSTWRAAFIRRPTLTWSGPVSIFLPHQRSYSQVVVTKFSHHLGGTSRSKSFCHACGCFWQVEKTLANHIMIKIDPEIVGPEISGIEKDSTRVAEFHHKTSLTCEAILLILDLLCSSCFQKNTWVVGCWIGTLGTQSKS